MSEINCYSCDKTLDAQIDEWYSYSIEEHPSREDVDQAIEHPEDFDEWFRQNFILCPNCKDEMLSVIE